MPQRDPTLATGGRPTQPCEDRRKGTGRNTTGQQEKTERNFNIMHWNAAGGINAPEKKVPLTERLNAEEIDIACLQETHLKSESRFGIRGYQVFRKDRIDRTKGGVLILVKNDIPAKEVQVSTSDQAEINGIDATVGTKTFRIFNVYCPPGRELSLETMELLDNKCMVTGDFNSHSEAWGYESADARGEEVEDWQVENSLTLLNDPEDTPTCFTGRWNSNTTPDLAFATYDTARITTRTVLEQLGGSDHKPVKLSLDLNYKPQEAKTFPRWNYKRANWKRFSDQTDLYSAKIRNKRKNLNTKVKDINQAILQAAKETIPRGARRNYRPYWTEELQEVEDALSKARDKVEEEPTQSNNIALKAATAKHRQTLIQETRKSWHEKTENLNLDKDGSKLWKLAKILNDETNRSSPITLQKDQQLLSGKKAADHLMDQYAETSTLQIPPGREKEVKEAGKEANEGANAEPLMNSPFTLEEFEQGLTALQLKKSPGPDKITNEMLLNLGPRTKKKLLQLYNESWKTGNVPQVWKDATMIPVHKKGKDKSEASSYRPISLTSCTGKLLERLINNRLMWHLERKQHISPEQAAFRQNRSTEDQVTYIAQSIEDGFQEKRHTLAVWIDMEKAFDKVWKTGLKLKLQQCGVAGRMFKWIAQYLLNRTARTQVGHHFSKKKVLKEGVPQGGVLSPTLFLVFIKDIAKKLPKNVKGAIYADDLAIWCSEEHISTANYRLNLALKEIEAWTKSWLVKLNERKTTFTLFTLSPKPQTKDVKLTVNSHQLKEEEFPTYLGVTLDRRLTWKTHLDKSLTRSKLRMTLMKKLAGTTWGADQTVLKKLYIGRIRPVLEYGSAATSTAAKSNTGKQDRLQNQAMRMMTGAMKSTPINALETETGLNSLSERRDTKILTQAAKFKCLQNHPMRKRMSEPTKGRLQRKSFIHNSRILERRDAELLDHEHAEIPGTPSVPAWKRKGFPKIQTSIPGIGLKGTQTDAERKSLTLEYIHNAYPEDQWTHAYTDGSASEARRDGGGGIFIKYSAETVRIPIATGKYSTNYRAEAEALERAAAHIEENRNLAKEQVVIFSDALSVLQAVKDSQNKNLNDLSSTLASLAEQKKLHIQWIPAHCGIYGNEEADKLAKEGSKLEQENHEISYEEKKTIVKAIAHNKWKREHPNYSPEDDFKSLHRKDQVILFRLRTGHNRMNYHLFNKLKIGETDRCPCKRGPMDTEHLLQTCPTHEELRKEIWPNAKQLREKLYGNLEDLRRTADFVRRAGITI